MLEFFRRHRTTLFVVIIIVMIAFTVWGGWRFDKDARSTTLPTDTAMTIYGKDYTIAEAQQMGRALQFSMQGLQTYDIYFGLSMLGGGGQGQRGGDAVGNAFVLNKLLDETGIRASDAEAVAELKKITAMQTNGQFDPAKAQDVEAMAAANGMNSADLLDLMRMKIGLEKLKDVVGKNYDASSFAGEKSYVSTQQTLKLSTIAFKTEDYKKGIEVKDDEIQKAYDEKKETLMSVEKRTVKYVFIENAKDLDKKELKDREAAEKAVSEKINAFTNLVLAKARTANIDEIAKDPKIAIKVETLPAFAQDAAPDAIKAEAELVTAIFQNTPKAQPVSDPIKGSRGYYFFSVSAIEEPKQQPLSEVKDKLKDGLITQKATEARTKAVNEIRDFLIAGLKDKKKIDDLVKEKKLTLVKLADMGNGIPPPEGMKEAQQVTDEGKKTAEGQISKPVDTEAGNLLIYVNAKELRKSDAAAAARKSQTDGLSSRERDGIFNAWFAKKLEEAAIVMPQRAETAA